MNTFLTDIQKRRSIYGLSAESTLSDQELQSLVETAVRHAPSAFNSQSSRVVLLTGESHQKLWNIVLEQLRARVPADKFGPTEEKIASFAAGYGSILYFEDQDIVQGLQEQFPTYADNFPLWSQQASGILQFIIWTALAQEGMGASLQHYSPLIDADVAEAFSIPKNWKLIAQMPFGVPTAPAGERQYAPTSERVLFHH
ncbi:MAG: nitroreductase family protein [Eubacterium aggregans]|uniref:Nitroreductase domain-containing protein n=1 Tax=Eubacterium aggregans TaxID=81409 RepID=A0A1H4DKL2_9FIRM|nr:nitroreductase family protein [Eubacterium aggregans]MEA5074411.1 nitroreductase family protein [Eubacterium aggregans]SEA73029.1 hypothetical protein SAMN04515656_12523 [Eubacterium aggregans]